MHNEGDTEHPTCDITNAMTSVRDMSTDFHRFSDNKSPKRLVAVIVSAGVANDHDRLVTEMRSLISDGFDIISIGKGIRR